MSVAALNWAFALPIEGPGKAVLVALADHADEHGGCWPSKARLELFSGCAERTIRKALKQLVALGVLAVERPTKYTLAIGRKIEIPARGAARLPRPNRHVVPNDRHVVPTEPARGAETPARGAAYIENHQEPPKEPPRNLLPIAPHEAFDDETEPVLVNGQVNAFEAWWAEYPAKRGGKAHARRAYAKAIRIVGVTSAGLLEALRVYPFDRKNFPQFIPHGSTWLNGGYYENAAEAACAATPQPNRGAGAQLRRDNLAALGLLGAEADPLDIPLPDFIDSTFIEEFPL